MYLPVDNYYFAQFVHFKLISIERLFMSNQMATLPSALETCCCHILNCHFTVHTCSKLKFDESNSNDELLNVMLSLKSCKMLQQQQQQ